MTYREILSGFIMTAGLILAVWGILNIYQQIENTLAGEGGVGATSCTIIASTTVTVGHQTSNEIVASHARNAYVIISQPVAATNTVALGFGNDASMSASSFKLGAGNATSTLPDRFEFGLNTDFPYTGSVEAITNTGTTTIGVTICRYQ